MMLFMRNIIKNAVVDALKQREHDKKLEVATKIREDIIAAEQANQEAIARNKAWDMEKDFPYMYHLLNETHVPEEDKVNGRNDVIPYKKSHRYVSWANHEREIADEPKHLKEIMEQITKMVKLSKGKSNRV